MAIIAVFYTGQLSVMWLALSAAIIALLIILNRFQFRALPLYLAAGVALWICVFNSGVHATLAGVALAFAVPTGDPRGAHVHSPLQQLEHVLHPWVAYLIVPIFGFANAGVSFAGMAWSSLFAPLPLGIAAGLFVGKQLGVFVPTYIAVRLGWARRPDGATFAQIYGVALLCGIGFTMSLFIGLLAFPTSPHLQDSVKIGVLAGSLISALVGSMVLLLTQRSGMLKSR